MTDIQEPKISPELYRQTLRELTLSKISLDQVQASCIRDIEEAGEIVVNIDYEARSEQTQSNYFAFITYLLHSERAGQRFLSIEATYRVTFNTNVPVPEGFFEVFERLNLRLTTLPYFRELAASTTGRMELPTLTLPYEIAASKATKQVLTAPAPARQKARSRKVTATQ